MDRTSRGWAWIVPLVGWVVATIGLGPVRLAASEPDRSGTTAAEAERTIDAHVSAGEFGPAIEVAARLTDRSERDRFWERIALAQSSANVPVGSQATLARIQDDRARTRAVDAIREQPIGGARGGVTEADFDPLINLITSTIAPDSWETNGGNGAIEPFVAGVYVDAEGVLRRIEDAEPERLDALRRVSRGRSSTGDPRTFSELRKVSLTRLEREVQLRWMAGQSPDEAMGRLAGLTRIRYVFLYPDTRDIVIAGPAAGWTTDALGNSVSDRDGAPVLRLDDLVVLMRGSADADGAFGCSIDPRPEHLERTRRFLDASAATPLRADRRDAWIGELRERLGRQDVSVFGIDPRSRPARVLVEADYRMKRVGIGLEPGPLGVPSYLEMAAAEEAGESMAVLRWWFAMHYDAVRTNADRSAFSMEGPAVRVLSENEWLTERGRRVPTGGSDDKSQRFADAFNRHYDAIAAKYPVYAELRGLFDLALAARLIDRESLRDRADWHAPHFSDAERFVVPNDAPPREVDSVANHRVVNQKRIVAAVSGGVHARPSRWTDPQAIQADSTGRVAYEYRNQSPAERRVPERNWWWD